jgi:hypothetical protein
MIPRRETLPTQDLKEMFELIALEDEKLRPTVTKKTTVQTKETLMIDGAENLVESPKKMGPPRTISVPTDRDGKSTIICSKPANPFAQLCYDQRQGTIVTMLEVTADGKRKQSRRMPWMTPEVFPSILASTPSSNDSSTSGGTVSTLTRVEGLDSFDVDSGSGSGMDPILLGDEGLSLYLLHESREPTVTGVGCSQVMQKLAKLNVTDRLKIRKRERTEYDTAEKHTAKRVAYRRF